MKLIIKIIIAIFTVTVPVLAQAEETRNPGYLTDKPDGDVVKNGFGECWHTSEWTPRIGFDSCGNPIVAAIEPESIPVTVQVAALEPEVIPVTHMISFSDEALFAFDKSVLKPEGKMMLDGLVRQLNDSTTTTYDDIMITGHTDRIGGSEYNQKLSERRAQTVRDYLIYSNVRTNRINAVGKGEMEPVTYARDCRGRTDNVIRCLQPDRRVDVRMSGTQTISSGSHSDSNMAAKNWDNANGPDIQAVAPSNDDGMAAETWRSLDQPVTYSDSYLAAKNWDNAKGPDTQPVASSNDDGMAAKNWKETR